MAVQYDNLEHEIDDLKQQLEHFQKEKERVRAIIGKIGGVPKFRAKLVNTIFIAVIIVTLAVSVVGAKEYRLWMIELATVALSLKIIYLIHSQMRVSHFEFWILSSLEWRINELMMHLRQMKKEQQS